MHMTTASQYVYADILGFVGFGHLGSSHVLDVQHWLWVMSLLPVLLAPQFTSDKLLNSF